MQISEIPKRIGAYIIDLIIVSAPFVIAGVIYVLTVHFDEITAGRNSEELMEEIMESTPYWIFMIPQLIELIYNTVFVAKWGRTPGKMLFGLWVVPKESVDFELVSVSKKPGFPPPPVNQNNLQNLDTSNPINVPIKSEVIPPCPSWNRAFIRALLPATLAIAGQSFGSGMLVYILYIPIFMTPLRQGIHDKAAGTVVLSRKSS